MKILVTGGNTLVPIDKVRGITNIFKGRTGVAIANEAAVCGHAVTLIGNPAMQNMLEHPPISFLKYRTYDELYELMEQKITSNNYDVIIHSAAVSDFQVVFATNDYFQLTEWAESDPVYKSLEDEDPKQCNLQKLGKIPSGSCLFLAMMPTEKIIDKIRNPWGFRGTLVKFKLQVDMTDEELIKIARKSRITSDADIIVANCLEWSRERAYIITDIQSIGVTRKQLPSRLMEHIDRV